MKALEIKGFSLYIMTLFGAIVPEKPPPNGYGIIRASKTWAEMRCKICRKAKMGAAHTVA
jgi:hypothetical protein